VVWKELADVSLPKRSQQGVADGVHERVGVGVSLETEAMGNLHAAEDQLASRRQRMDVITDSNMNHWRTIGAGGLATKPICKAAINLYWPRWPTGDSENQRRRGGRMAPHEKEQRLSPCSLSHVIWDLQAIFPHTAGQRQGCRRRKPDLILAF